MIIDSIKNAHKYYCIHPSFKTAFEALEKINSETEKGRITVDGENIFINFSEYKNKNVDECPYESHKKYIDIQFVVKGREFIDICPAEALKVTEDRLETDDIAFFENGEAFSRADLTEGTFAVIFPEEAHRPCVAPDGVGVMVTKAVAKIIY